MNNQSWNSNETSKERLGVSQTAMEPSNSEVGQRHWDRRTGPENRAATLNMDARKAQMQLSNTCAQLWVHSDRNKGDNQCLRPSWWEGSTQRTLSNTSSLTGWFTHQARSTKAWLQTQTWAWLSDALGTELSARVIPSAFKCLAR